MNNSIRLVRYSVPAQQPRLGIVRDDKVLEFAPTIASFSDLIKLMGAPTIPGGLLGFVQTLKTSTSYFYKDLDCAPNNNVPHLLMPIVPTEVWGAGVTYERSRSARNEEEKVSSGIYDKVYSAVRPELFFKATSSRCVGPNEKCGIRADSKWTVPEPEFCLILSDKGEILAYSLGDDMNARDIEGENPLYLPQAKIHRACFSFGPTIFIPDPKETVFLSMWCRILRNGKEVFCDKTDTSHLHRPFSDMVKYLLRMNIPAFTVLSTGTGIVPPEDFALQENDVIEIGSEQIGVLRNTVIVVNG